MSISTEYATLVKDHAADKKRKGKPIMATIKEIATLAGVSRGTVDRVLNHRGDVNPQTEKRSCKSSAILIISPIRQVLFWPPRKKI